jgi:hypothetical protein
MTAEYDSAFPGRAAVTPRFGEGSWFASRAAEAADAAGAHRGAPDSSEPGPPATDPHVHAMRDFISCVRDGRPSPVPIDEGLRSLELVLGAGRLAVGGHGAPDARP